ncbi:MAG TPA: chitobiase/beta-hexosaminidase C-terminal domain-containing protein [Terracidiphilus sp.]|jgi:N-acetylneuraminic acid mutarotase|nr:chitobiase/beta-hexosaminidase C-terminal domain-containing protein [Terracidiphilus sp.]
MKTPIAPASILGGSSESRHAATLFLNRLVWLSMILLLAGLCLPAHAQTGEWVWMGGSQAENQPGVYGTLGTPAQGNTPGSRLGPAGWTDGSGHRWLFGGNGYDAVGNSGPLNDVWEFTSSTNEWTWMGGSSTENQPGVYGTLGTPAAGNIPGSRWHAANWTDGSGHFWLFGGTGIDAAGNNGYLNDLWEFNPSTNQWTWMGGGNAVNQIGRYGTLGVPESTDIPGSREPAASWTDSDGHFWLYGGFGYDANGNDGWLDDLWEFNPSTNKWTFTIGSRALHCYVGSWGAGTECISAEVYGTLGIAAAGNIPGGRDSASVWTDANDNFWLFGGYGTITSGCTFLELPCQQQFDELWEFNPSTNEWAWMGGSPAGGCNFGPPCSDPGAYGTLGVPAAGNIPGSRVSASKWTDTSGNFWIFGGNGSTSWGAIGDVNDLWEFNPSTSEWTWMNGCATLNGGGAYGSLGTPAAGNVPGSRFDASSWTDSSGNLWLFGGTGFVDDKGDHGTLNDLWEFLPTATSPPGAAPTFSPPPGTYTSPQSVSISDSTSGAIIRYTLDGSPSTVCSPAYTVPLTIGLTSQTITVNAIAVASDYANSLTTATYTINLPTAAGPVFTPAAGTYTSIQSVQLFSSTPGAVIYYTLDGSRPTTASPQYTAALTIGQTTTVNALVVAYGYTNSLASATYTINLPIAKIVFTPPTGTYTTTQSVQISSIAPGAAIYYTLDDSGPTTSSTRYTAALTIAQTTTVKVLAVAYNYTDALKMAIYTINLPIAATPVFTPPAGTYTSTQSVQISTATPGTTIYYTLDGTEPTTGSARYTTALTIDGYTTVKAIAVAYNYATSLAIATYAVNPNMKGEWVWMGGSSTASQPGVYGTIGTPAPGNIPGSRNNASSWTDGSGNLWLFGGDGFDVSGNQGYLNDLWEFNPSANEWTWMGGSNTVNQNGVYGTLGTPAAGNIPVGRLDATSWTDSNGNLWLFGGGLGAGPWYQALNDLWEFSPSTNEWAWMGGSSTTGQYGVYGTLGTPAPGNIPGGRWGAASWTDKSGHLWLFGGLGLIWGEENWLNELWEFNPSTNEWTWMGGYGGPETGEDGPLGTPAPGNIPGGRQDPTAWTDESGDLWLFGGAGYSANSLLGALDDIWEINPSTNEWAWMGGSGERNAGGVYGTLGTPAVGNTPGSRSSAARWTDSDGRLWLLGGGGTDATGSNGSLNDFWEFDPFTNEWGWMGGSNTINQNGVYGTLGTPAVGNTPGGRSGGSSWTDSDGQLWLFGGVGKDATGNSGSLNDVWEFVPFSTPPQAAATPTFSLSSGTYTSTQTVSISDTTPDAVLYYTLDGTSPTIYSAKYQAALAIGQTTTVNVVAVASGYSNSAASATYILNLPTAAAPVFSPPAGAYTSIQSVQISSTTPGAVIYYTLDGSNPTTGSATYSAALTIGQTTTVKAITVALGYANSMASATYTINLPAAAAPVFSPPAGAYNSIQSVQLSSTTPGAVIYYTLDGSTPTTSSARYSTALTVSNAATVINAIALAYDYNNSVVASAAYTIRPAAPTFSLPSGEYLTSQSLTITAAAGATIYYTTDGSAPSSSSTPYTGAITIDGIVTIRATAVLPGCAKSPYTTAEYAIKTAAPTFSLPSGTYLTPQSLTISGGAGAKFYYTTDGSAPSASATPYTGAIAIDKNVTIRATAVVSGYANSPYVTAEYAIKVAAPTFSLASGEYFTPQSLTISDATPSATIYYTTDGSAPSSSSTPYTGGITIDKDVTIRATAMVSGHANSPYVTAEYGIKVPAPVISPGTGIYLGPQPVTISDSMAGAAIYYTTDGSRPTTSSIPYTGAITVSSKEKIIAIATAAGYANSPLVYADYGIR